MKRAKEQTETKRVSYVQSSLLFGLGGGIQLADLRDLVEATKDYSEGSRVILKPRNVTVVETRTSHWVTKGVSDD